MIKLVALLVGAFLVGLDVADGNRLLPNPQHSLKLLNKAYSALAIPKRVVLPGELEEMPGVTKERMSDLRRIAEKIFRERGYPSECDDDIRTIEDFNNRTQCVPEYIELDSIIKSYFLDHYWANKIKNATIICRFTAMLSLEHQCLDDIKRYHSSIEVPAQVEQLFAIVEESIPNIQMANIADKTEYSDEVKDKLIAHGYPTECDNYNRAQKFINIF